MNEDTIIVEGPANTEMQSVTVEDGSPYTCDEVPRQPMMQKVGMFAFPCIIGLIYLAVAVFVIVMLQKRSHPNSKAGFPLRKKNRIILFRQIDCVNIK